MNGTQLKTGVKTSEFYVSLVTSILGILLAKGVLMPEHTAAALPYIELVQQILGAVVVMISGATYTIARTMAKRRH